MRQYWRYWQCVSGGVRLKGATCLQRQMVEGWSLAVAVNRASQNPPEGLQVIASKGVIKRIFNPLNTDTNIIQENSPFVQSEAWEVRNHSLVSNMFI